MKSKDQFINGTVETDVIARYVLYVDESVRKNFINGPRRFPASEFEINAIQVRNSEPVI
jgi:hypothetical protein